MTPDPQKQNLPCTEKETEAHRGRVHCQGHTELNKGWRGSKTHVFSTILLGHAVPSFSIDAAPSACVKPVLGQRESSEQNRPKSPPWGAHILEQHWMQAPGVIYNFLSSRYFFFKYKEIGKNRDFSLT